MAKGRHNDRGPLLACDLPIDQPGLIVHHELALTGWAASAHGIASVIVRIGERELQASYGLDSPWVTEAIPDMPGTDDAAYELRLDTSQWAPIKRTVSIVATDREGRSTEMAGEVEVVPFDDPQYTVEANRAAIARGEPVMWLEQPRIVDGVPELDGAMEVSGWAYARDGLKLVIVTVDGRSRYEALRPISRSDLLADYGREVAGEAGFAIRIDALELPPGPHNVSVVAIAEDGQAVGVAGEVLRRADRPEPDGEKPPRVEWLSERSAPRPRRREGDGETGAAGLDTDRPLEADALASALMWEDRARLAEADAAASRTEANLAQMHQRGTVGRLREVEAQLQEAAATAVAIEASLSWRITRPLRSLKRRLHSLGASK